MRRNREYLQRVIVLVVLLCRVRTVRKGDKETLEQRYEEVRPWGKPKRREFWPWETASAKAVEWARAQCARNIRRPRWLQLSGKL